MVNVLTPKIKYILNRNMLLVFLDRTIIIISHGNINHSLGEVSTVSG